VLAVLHDLTMAAGYADRVAIMEAGRLTALGPTETTLDPVLLSQVFATPILRLQAGATMAFVSPGATTPNRT
jgi:iron complex transport system ATP-binding protein